MLPFYEYNTRQFQLSSGREMNFPPHLHGASELLYVKCGEIYTQHGEDFIAVKGGELILFFPNEVHSYTTTVPNTSYIMLNYRGKLCEEIEKLLSTKRPKNFHLRNIPTEVVAIIDILERAEENHEPAIVLRLYYELILARLLPIVGLGEKEDIVPDNLLTSVLSFITENFAEPISLESLGRRFGVSRYKISRLFTHTLNIGLSDYVNTMRVDKAKSLLQNPENSVIEVAFTCGFESQQTFNRVFKDICGATPKDFRRQINV